MAFLRKKKEQVVIPSRITKTTTSELIQWTDVSLMEVGRAFDAWRFHGQSLGDVKLAAETVINLVTELSNRNIG